MIGSHTSEVGELGRQKILAKKEAEHQSVPGSSLPELNHSISNPVSAHALQRAGGGEVTLL